MIVPGQEKARPRRKHLSARERCRGALVRRQPLFVAAVHEGQLHAAAVEAGAFEGAARFRRRVAEAEERHLVRERIRAPGRFVEDAHVVGEIAAREQRARRVRIVIPGRHIHRLAEAGELLEQKAHGLRPRPFALVEVAADREDVGAARERFIDDAHERIGEGFAPGRATARLHERRFQMHVRAVHDADGHTRLAEVAPEPRERAGPSVGGRGRHVRIAGCRRRMRVRLHHR